MIDDIMDFLFGSFPRFLVLLGVVLAGLTYAVVADERAWRAFVVEHNCKQVGHITGSTGFGVGVAPNGGVAMVPVSIPGKTGWRCDDGQEYWR